MNASILARPRRVTAEDLEMLSAQGGHYELIEGELREMAPPGGMHGSSTLRLSTYVGMLVIGSDLGEGFTAETGFLVGRDPDTVLAPDFAFIVQERVPEPLPKGYIPVVPDLVLETRSPGDSRRAVAEKVARWLSVGVRLVWELDPAARVLTVHRPGMPPQSLGAEDTLDGADVLPGLSLPVRQLFPPGHEKRIE